MKFGRLIRYLIVVTLILGVYTVYIIDSLGVPSFIVYSAAAILVIYLFTFIWFSVSESRSQVYITAMLSLLTMAATFSSTAHLQLLEAGYLPAVFIISAGFTSQAVLFVTSILSLRSPKVAEIQETSGKSPYKNGVKPQN